MQHDDLDQSFENGYANRLEDAEDFALEDDSSHLWAVSYADFLMVLLSFFVIFFSLDQEAKEKVKQQIVENQTFLKLENDLLQKAKPVATAAKNQGNSEPTDKRFLASVIKKFNSDDFDLNIDKTDYPREIQIFLPDNVFAINSVELDPKGRKSLARVLNTLMPYAKDLQITFVGHSDSSKLIPKSQKLIANNFTLSSLRASDALVRAIRAGFPANSLNISGQADIKRNSRTLTVKVKAKEEK